MTNDLEEARRDVIEKLSGAAFGDAGRTIVIEEGLLGEECSLHVLCDGTTTVPLVAAQDFKRVGDGDEGANTGGMGAYAPIPSLTSDQVYEIMRLIITPTLDELRRRGLEFRGVLYAGVMLTRVRTEAAGVQRALRRSRGRSARPALRRRLSSMFCCSAPKDGSRTAHSKSSGAAVTVVLAAEGYPQHPRKGDVIDGLGDDGQLVDHVTTSLSFTRHVAQRGGSIHHARRSGARGDGIRAERRRSASIAPTTARRPISFKGSIRRSDIALAASEGRLVIPRYAPNDVAALFSDEHRFDTMLEVELLAAEALAELGVVPKTDAAALRTRRPVVDAAFVEAVNEREAVTNHDTAAFVDVVQERIGMPEGAWVHYGLTSSDVVDTALCFSLTAAMDIVVNEVRQPSRRADETAAELSVDTPIVGRTHGQHAEPTTYGAKFALFALQVIATLSGPSAHERASP